MGIRYYGAFQSVPEPSVITVPTTAPPTAPRAVPSPAAPRENGSPRETRPRPTFTGLVGSLCMFPLRAIINTHWHRDQTGANEALMSIRHDI